MFKQSAQHIASYYAQCFPGPIPLRPTLQDRLAADVLVIGGGFSGLHTALRLALAGKRVVLLEASRVAWAALYDAQGAHLNPLKLTQGLAAAIEAADGQIFEQSQVLDYRESAGGFVACTANRPLKNVGEAASARQKQAKKRSLRAVNEHFEPVFNAAMATQVVFQRPAKGEVPLEAAGKAWYRLRDLL